MNTQPTSPLRVTPQIILGLLIVAFGIILTLDNLDYLEAGDILRYWPLLLVAFGLARMVSTNCTSGRLSGGGAPDPGSPEITVCTGICDAFSPPTRSITVITAK